MAFAGSSGRAPDGRTSTDAGPSADPGTGARAGSSGRRARAGTGRAGTAAGAEAPSATHGTARRHTASWRASGQARRGVARAGASATEQVDDTPRRPRGRPFSRSIELDVDWPRAGTFGAGLAVGALLGAGVALLLAPSSGTVTRRRIGRVGRRASVRAADAWAELGEELRHATFRTRRKLRRGLGTGGLADFGAKRKRKQERRDEADEGGRRMPWARRRAETEITVEI
jgi:gas vesicle protein